MIYILYSLVLFGLSIYSYALIDPNLTLINNNYWEVFRNEMVYLGYHRRDISWVIYLTLVLGLFLLHLIAVKRFKQISIIKLCILIAGLLVLSYPFLSHDFFNYMFDAKILTFYHKSPYLFKALDFPSDQWTRFMNWTHRAYPYGPVFLLVSLVPSFLGAGKFFISFILFKFTFISFYILGAVFLSKINKKQAVFYMTNPLVIMEGIVSSHNDLIALSLGLIGVYYIIKKKSLASRLFFVFSGLIKYITAPLIFLTKDNKYLNIISFGLILGLLGYLSISDAQPWYFLALFIFLPYYYEFLKDLSMFFLGLLLSYYPYIRIGDWGSAERVNIKHLIIVIFAGANLLYLLFKNRKFFIR